MRREITRCVALGTGPFADVLISVPLGITGHLDRVVPTEACVTIVVDNAKVHHSGSTGAVLVAFLESAFRSPVAASPDPLQRGHDDRHSPEALDHTRIPPHQA
jgi:hypothetical protein